VSGVAAGLLFGAWSASDGLRYPDALDFLGEVPEELHQATENLFTAGEARRRLVPSPALGLTMGVMIGTHARDRRNLLQII
jgi:hypothetical protein